MTREDFWKTIDEVNRRTGGDPLAKEPALEALLSDRDAPDILAFSRHLDQLRGEAYTWSLWAAAYIIQGGCSDDSFMDFRCCLVFQGQEIFERALADPDSLAALDDRTLNGLFYEGLLYVPYQLYEQKAGPMPEPDSSSRPLEPAGKPWDEEDLPTLHPTLNRRFGESPLDGNPYD